MTDKTLSALLSRFITLYLFLPIAGLSLIMICYAGWQRLEGLRFQKRNTVVNAARSIEANLAGLSRDLQRSGLLLREKDHWSQLDLLNYLNYRTSFDRLLLLKRSGQIFYALNDMDRRLPELTSIFDAAQLRLQSVVQISKPYVLEGEDDARLAFLAPTPSGELLLGEVGVARIQANLARFASSKNEFIFLADSSGRLLAPGQGQHSRQAAALVDILPDREKGASESSIRLIEQTVLSTSHIPEPDLRLALVTPLNSLLSSFAQYIGFLLVAVILTILAVTALMFRRMDTEVIQPIRSLRQSVSKLKQGEYPVLPDSSLSAPRFREFDELEFEFRSMIKILALREASLRQKTSEQQLLLDNVPLQIWFMVDQETQGMVNESRARFLGLPSEDVAYKNLNEVLDLESADVEIETNRSVFENKHSLEFEAWFRNAFGELRYLSIRKVPKLTDGGQVEFVVCTVQDKTEHQRYEQKLHELSTAVEQSPASIIITDSSGIIQYVNPSFCQLSGYSEEEVLGRSPGLLKSGDKPDEEYAKLWRTISGGQTWQGEFRNRGRSGAFYWVSALISPIFNKSGDISHYVAFQEDITAKKEIENELLRAKLEAESANEAKSQFLANISHEIRTPLNGIIGMCSLLLDSDLSEENRIFAETISSSANNLLEIINQILDFSKIESGVLELENIVFDLYATIKRTMGLFTSQAMEKGLELDQHIEEGVPSALIGDPVRLQQILMNLLGNGVKFTEAGSVALRVSPQFSDEEALLLKFEILDTGPGIPRDKLQTIFEPFIQADGSTTRKYGGTGLGLSICRQLVEMMGGQMGADTQEGSGSKFWFTVRFRTAKQTDPASPALDNWKPQPSRGPVAEEHATYCSRPRQGNGIFDPDHLIDKLGDDPETMTAILDSFIDDVRQRLASVKQGLESADAGRVEAEAFNLKGSSANIGAKDLARTASAVEEACSEGDLDKARQLVDSFLDEFRMFQWATNNLVASFPEHDRLKGRE